MMGELRSQLDLLQKKVFLLKECLAVILRPEGPMADEKGVASELNTELGRELDNYVAYTRNIRQEVESILERSEL